MKSINIEEFKISGSFNIKESATTYDIQADDDEVKKELRRVRKKLGKLQDTL